MDLKLFGGFFCLHLACQWTGNHFFFESSNIPTIWPTSGLLMAALYLLSCRQWFPVIAAAILSGITIDIGFFDRSADVFALFASAGLIEAMLGAWLLAKVTASKIDFEDLTWVLNFIALAGLLATAIGASVGAAGIVLLDQHSPILESWLIWWFSDLLGVTVLAPPILIFYRFAAKRFKFDAGFSRLELWVTLSLLGAVALLIFSNHGEGPALLKVPYLIAPMLIWIALRFEPIISTMAILTVTLIALIAGQHELGPFVGYSDNLREQVLAMQSYVAVAACGVMIICAAVQQQKRDYRSLIKATEARRTAMESIHERYWRYDRDLNLEVWNFGNRSGGSISGLERVGLPLIDELRYWTEQGWHGPGDPETLAQQRLQQYLDGSIPRFEQRYDDDRLLEIRRYRSPDGGYTETIIDITDQIETERSARYNEALFKAFLANSPNLITIKDVSGNYIHASDSFLKIHQLRLSQVIGRTPKDLFDEETAEQIASADRNCLENKEIRHSEVMVDTAEGQKNMAMVRFPVADSEGRILAVGSIASDLTDLYQKQQQLAEIEERHRLTLESVGSGGWDYDVANRQVLLSDRLLSLLGYTPEETDSSLDNLIDNMHPDDRERVQQALVSHLKGELPLYEAELRVRDAHGAWRWMLMRGAAVESDEDGKVSRIVGANFDINDRKIAEQTIIESEEKFRNLAEGSLQGIAVFDADWQIDYVNPSLANMLGFDSSSALMALDNWIHCIAEHELERMQDYRDRRIRGAAAPTQYETQLIKRNGGVIDVLVGVRMIEWDRHRAFQYLVFDISDQKKATARLHQYQNELRRLAGKMSLAEEGERRRIASELHDGTVQNLVLSKMLISQLEKSQSDENNAATTSEIRELLESSLRETRSLIFEISPPVLYELGLVAALQWLGEQFERRTGIDTEISMISADLSLIDDLKIVLFQSVRELLINVSKHARASRVILSGQIVGDRLELRVSDNGIGFDINQSQKKSVDEGGFGLFSLRERLRLLEARLIIQSSDSGTEVIISAPIESNR